MVEIRDKQELLLSSDGDVFRQELFAVLECMREELDDHRLAINENTAEQSSAYEFLNELNRKMDKLAERVDELTMLVKGEKREPQFALKPLSGREKQVFHALFLLTEMQPYASYDQIAKKAGMAKGIVIADLSALVQKGVPLVKKQEGSSVFVKLDPMFRELQTKHNVIGLNSLLTCWL